MNTKLKKNLFNILLGLIPFTHVRKNLRLKFLSSITAQKIPSKEAFYNQINNNKFIIKTPKRDLLNHKKEGLKVNFVGKNSSVIIHEPTIFKNCSINVGNNSIVEIFSSNYNISCLKITATNNSKVIIKENFSCVGCSIENHDESNLKVVIGSDCMFSYGVCFRASDGHSIYQINDSEIINKPKQGITIGNHVWIGMNSTILKDVSISSNTIVGAHSLVTKSTHKENVILAGVPAKILREGVSWTREHTEHKS